MTIEMLSVATIVVLGLIAGLTTLRDSVTNEVADLAGAVDDLVQTYTVDGIQSHHAQVAGMDYQDHHDECDEGIDDNICTADQCVVWTDFNDECDVLLGP